MTIKVESGRTCVCCGNKEAFIAIGKRDGNFTFSDLISNQVCWECYVAVMHPVDRKLRNAKTRIAEAYAGRREYNASIRHDCRNVEAWEEAIRNKQIQRQLYGIV